MILYTMLQRFIGRKLLTEIGLGDFGIRTMSEPFASLDKHPLVKKDVIARVTMSPTIGQNSL